MSIKYGESLLFKPQNVCKQSGRIKVLSITNTVEDEGGSFTLKRYTQRHELQSPMYDSFFSLSFTN